MGGDTYDIFLGDRSDISAVLGINHIVPSEEIVILPEHIFSIFLASYQDLAVR